MKWIAKLGYLARGAVYAAVAYFAALSALGQGTMQDTHGALTHIAQLPHGRALIGTMFAGLTAFALWRCVQSAMDVDRHGSSAMAWFIRVGLLISAAVHGALAYWTLGLFNQHPESSASAAAWTGRLLAQPWGRWIILFVALALALIAAAHFYKALTRRFLRYLEPAADARWSTLISQVGLIARGILFLIFAYFATRAAWHLDPAQTKDLAHVLHWLQSLPHPHVWEASIAVGMGAFAFYSLLEGWFRVVPPPRPLPAPAGR